MTGSRDADSATITASQADIIHPLILAKLEFDSGDVLVHSGLGNVEFNSETYVGVGQFGGISAAEENSDLARSPLTLTLSNIPGDMGAIVLGEHYQGRRATLYLGYRDLSTSLLVGDPAILYRGRLDHARIKQGKTFTVTVSIENRMASWDKPLVRRYNNADQQGRYQGDMGLQYVEQSAEKEINWGGKL